MCILVDFCYYILGFDSANDSPGGFVTRTHSVTSSGYNEDEEKTDDKITFTVAEVQLIEKENSLLFNELNSLTEEVNQIQGRVVKIAELQQTLTEKVLDQEKDIERIATTTVSVCIKTLDTHSTGVLFSINCITILQATENIREGNEQLRQALQSNSGFRIALIFFILVLFFSLLFLDWYND